VQIKLVQDAATRFLTDNATTVLTATGVVGTVATAVLSFRAGMKSERIINDNRFTVTVEEETELSTMDKVKLVGGHVVPPVATGAGTITAIIMADRISAKRAAALAAAYGVAQGQLDEYKAKVLEKLGVQKSEKLHADLAQDRMEKNQNANQVIIIGDNVLCYDMATDRYFQSSMEAIRTAENKANREILECGYYSATDFYDQLGLESTTWSDDVGWHQNFQLEYSTIPAKDGRPCLAIDFSRLPTSDYVREHSRYSP
jgi:hypothetical protein